MGLACATFLSSWPGVLRQLRCVHKKRGISACKYASKRLKASCASYTQRARAACFVPVMQKNANQPRFSVESKKVAEVPPKKGTKNQKPFLKMYIMQLDNIKMTVGLQKSTGDKVQYCITAL